MGRRSRSRARGALETRRLVTPTLSGSRSVLQCSPQQSAGTEIRWASCRTTEKKRGLLKSSGGELQQATKHTLVLVRVGSFLHIERRDQVAPSEKLSTPPARRRTLDGQVCQLQNALEPGMHAVPSAELDHAGRPVDLVGDHEDSLVVAECGPALGRESGVLCGRAHSGSPLPTRSCTIARIASRSAGSWTSIALLSCVGRMLISAVNWMQSSGPSPG